MRVIYWYGNETKIFTVSEVPEAYDHFCPGNVLKTIVLRKNGWQPKLK